MNFHMEAMQLLKDQSLNKEISDQDWDNFVYNRKSLRGKHLELMATFIRM